MMKIIRWNTNILVIIRQKWISWWHTAQYIAYEELVETDFILDIHWTEYTWEAYRTNDGPIDWQFDTYVPPGPNDLKASDTLTVSWCINSLALGNLNEILDM